MRRLTFFLVLLMKITKSRLENCQIGSCFIYNRTQFTEKHRLAGYTYARLSPPSHMSCLEMCYFDCRCLSVNINRAGDDCEMNDEDTQSSGTSLQADDDYDYAGVIIKAQSPSGTCFNGCCAGIQCANGGECTEICNHPQIRFECKCTPGYRGKLCRKEIPAGMSTSQPSPTPMPASSTIGPEPQQSSTVIAASPTPSLQVDSSSTLLTGVTSSPSSSIVEGAASTSMMNVVESSTPQPSSTILSSVSIYIPERPTSHTITECTSYTNLEDPTRHSNASAGTICDDQFDGLTWYRFVGRSGSQMSTTNLNGGRCSSNYTGRATQLPAANVEERIQICFDSATTPCAKTKDIDIINCGTFYIYKLKKVGGTPDCPYRYCGV